uniref:GG11420 n=2 Tax=Drosophila erecta TaxID=7220 RepID=B3P6G5_DROER
MKFLEPETTMSPETDILHPDDAQYIWLPISVLVGIFVLAALVYAMSRSRCRCSWDFLGCRKAPRSGYINVDAEDSDVPMACGDELGDQRTTASLLTGRLHIQDGANNASNA